MKRQTLVNGLLTFTAVSFMTGCVDDKYDLSDIDTTSRFTVNNLTVPVNLSEIKLENVINLDDNDNITVENGEYVIKKEGLISPTEFNLEGVHVNAPDISSTSIHIGLDGLPVAPGSFISAPVDLGPINIGSSDLVGYDFSMHNVDAALELLDNINTSDISVKVVLTVLPEGIASGSNSIKFENLELQLPWGLSNVSGVTGYDKNTGKVIIPELPVGSNGEAVITIVAGGLELNEKGVIKQHELPITGQVGVLGGQIKLSVQNITLPNSLDIAVNYEASGFDVESFSGNINYKMADINIAPISLSDLPDFLDNPETNLFIANPEITIDVNNPVAKYRDLLGQGKLTLTSTFKNGVSIARSSEDFKLIDHNGDGMCKIILTPNVIEGEQDMYAFPELGYVLTYYEKDTAGISLGWGLPESISVGIEDLVFKGHVNNFPLSNIGSASGDYSFKAPLGFEYGSTVIYETTEGDWGSEDLEKVNIRTINLTADCSTDLPVSINLSIVPVDKQGNVIDVNEDNIGFEVPAYANKETVTLKISAKNGGTISGFDGVKFKATIKQNSNNTEALGPNLTLKLDDIRVTVDGYYETDF